MVPLLIKQIVGVILIIVLIANLILFAAGRITMDIFWLVLGFGFLSIFIVKRL